MQIQGRNVLVLGGYGLVGIAVCREVLKRCPRRLQIHSFRMEEAEKAIEELRPIAGDAELVPSAGDIFGLVEDVDRKERIRSQIGQLAAEDLPRFRLYKVLADGRPDIVVDCVNTATGIAYRDIFSAATRAAEALDGENPSDETVLELLEALYTPRLIRHIQVLYRGMMDAETGVYVKVGTSGTGGMGLNIPYTHSEERPSRMLLAKSALAGAHSLLLFLMARTPGAPITKEIKPAAAIAWKAIAHGPIRKKGKLIHRVEAAPRPLGETFSSRDPSAGRELDEPLTTVYIDTGENGIFSLEEFAALTTAEQMEFVTPEEIAGYMMLEIEGGNTGHDIINALDNAVLGPTYRAGLMRHWALERMNQLERKGSTRSVAFEMLGPPRLSKLLFEAHLLRETFGTMSRVRNMTPEQVRDGLDARVRGDADLAGEVVAIGIPILLAGGEVIRGPEVIVPVGAENEAVTPTKLEAWVHDGWVDLRLGNCARWIDRFDKILTETEAIPEADTSSRYLRNRDFWHQGTSIQPGKVVGWILSEEEKGGRLKR